MMRSGTDSCIFYLRVLAIGWRPDGDVSPSEGESERHENFTRRCPDLG